MSNGDAGVRAQLSAVDAIIAGLAALHQASMQATDAAQASIRVAQSQTTAEHQSRQRALSRAEGARAAAERALAACKENCGSLQRAVAAARIEEDRCRRRVDASSKAMTIVTSASSQFAGKAPAFRNVVDTHARTGKASASRYRDQVRQYLS